MKFSPYLVACMSVLLAIIAWTGVYLFVSSIGNMAQATAAARGNIATESNQTNAALQTETLARTIAPERTQLESMLTADPISLAAAIMQAGTDAGVTLKVSSASPEASNPATAFQLSAIDFTIEATGSFQSLTQTELLLETLSVPSQVKEFDISQLPGTTTRSRASWELNGQIRVLTNAPLSS